MLSRFRLGMSWLVLLVPPLDGLPQVAHAAEQAILRTGETEAAIGYRFSAEDERLLDEIQRGCFEFLWKEVGDPVPLVKDRLTNTEVSSLVQKAVQVVAQVGLV